MKSLQWSNVVCEQLIYFHRLIQPEGLLYTWYWAQAVKWYDSWVSCYYVHWSFI